jgi:hypothetical protein
MKDIRKRPFRDAPGLIPEDLLGMTAACPICGLNAEVPWLAKMEFPKHPLKSDHGPTHWVPVSIPINCASQQCAHEFDVNVPILPNTNRWGLFGDEAGRYIAKPPSHYAEQPLNFFCITLVSLHRSRQERLRKQIFNLKKSIRPTDDPDSWAHHFTEIWNSKPEEGGYQLPNKAAKIAHAKSFAKIIREARPELSSFNVSECVLVPADPKERKKVLRQQKERVFAESILTTLAVFRRQGKSVNWTFDNVQDTTERSKTEGWASECFLGLQYTRLFTWVSAGATVLEPTFVTPGSNFLLEVADFISYCVARDFERAIVSQRPEFPSSLLGQGFYQGTLGNGDVESMHSFGLPLKKFYGIDLV